MSQMGMPMNLSQILAQAMAQGQMTPRAPQMQGGNQGMPMPGAVMPLPQPPQPQQSAQNPLGGMPQNILMQKMMQPQSGMATSAAMNGGPGGVNVSPNQMTGAYSDGSQHSLLQRMFSGLSGSNGAGGGLQSILSMFGGGA